MSDWDDFPGPTLRRLRVRRALKKWWEDAEKEHEAMKDTPSLREQKNTLKEQKKILEDQLKELSSKIMILESQENCDHFFSFPVRVENIEQHEDPYYERICSDCHLKERSIKAKIVKVVRIHWPGGFVQDIDKEHFGGEQ